MAKVKLGVICRGGKFMAVSDSLDGVGGNNSGRE